MFGLAIDERLPNKLLRKNGALVSGSIHLVHILPIPFLFYVRLDSHKCSTLMSLPCSIFLGGLHVSRFDCLQSANNVSTARLGIDPRCL